MTVTRQGSNRVTVYPNEIAFETDVLRSNMYKMADIAFLAQSLIGNGFGLGNAYGGLPCAPTSPTSLNVTVGPGAMYSYQQYEPTNWSTINADTTDMLYKQAINLFKQNTSTFTGGPITAPGTIGQSVYWIIEAAFLTQDIDSTSRQYYDPTNPTVPIVTTASATRQDIISFKLKQGTPYAGTSPDPTQIPSPDAGFDGLYALFVTHGQTAITSGNISVYPGAPFIVSSAEDVVTFNDFQNSYPIFAVDTGIANAYVANPAVAYQAFAQGQQISVFITHTNTGSSTLNVSATSAITIKKDSNSGPVALTGGELVANQIYIFYSDGTNWIVKNPSFAASIGTSGYCYLPNGLILQWGSFTITATGTPFTFSTVTFPLAFPNNALSVTTSYGNDPSTTFGGATTAAYSLSASQFQFKLEISESGHNIDTNTKVFWIATGN